MATGCSKLNNDLFNNLNGTGSPFCTCGTKYENVEHFFLYYPHLNVIKCYFIGHIQVVIPIDIDHIGFF